MRTNMAATPEEVPAAIGLVALNFAELEDSIAEMIAKALEVQQEIGQIIVAEMSFKNRVHLLGSLLRRVNTDPRLNVGHVNSLEMISELVAQCFRAEELRNQVMHSSWQRNYPDSGKVRRRKITAKASRGLHVQHEDVDSGYLLDIADFIICISIDVEDMFLIWEGQKGQAAAAVGGA
jgi:hypothetical protein